MAIHLDCPNCGRRPYTEFWFCGEVPAVPSSLAHAAEEEADYARVWTRLNAPGLQRETWFHFAGCRRLLHAERDTQTNEIHGVA